MKKKIKDLTIGEVLTICDNTEFNECYFGECKIDHLCGILHLDQVMPNLSVEDKNILEREIDI